MKRLLLAVFIALIPNLVWGGLTPNGNFYKGHAKYDQGLYAASFWATGDKDSNIIMWFSPDGQIQWQGDVGGAAFKGAANGKALLYDYENKRVTLLAQDGSTRTFQLIDSQLKSCSAYPGPDGFFIECSLTKREGNYSKYNSVLAKVDYNGTVQWSREFTLTDPSSYDNQLTTLTYLLPTNDGGCLANFESFIDGTFVKLNASGEIEWKKYVQPPNFSDKNGFSNYKFQSFDSTGDGKYFLVGYAKTQEKHLSRPLLVCLSSNGEVEWAKVFELYGHFSDISCSNDGCLVTYETEAGLEGCGVVSFSVDGEIESVKAFRGLEEIELSGGPFPITGMLKDSKKPVMIGIADGEEAAFEGKTIEIPSEYATLYMLYYNNLAIGASDIYIAPSNYTLSTFELNEPLSGWWYDPEEPGTGIALESQGSKLFLAWFLYDQNGKAKWFSSFGDINNSSYSSELLEWQGWPWGTTYHAPSFVSVGTVSLSDGPELTFSAQVEGASLSKTLVKFMPSFAGEKADPRDLTGWWWSPDYNGMGFFTEVRNGKMALVWYHYGENGEPTWFISSGDFPLGEYTYSGKLLGWKNGQCLGCPYKEPEMFDTGLTISIDFSTGNATINGTSFPIEKFVFSEP